MASEPDRTEIHILRPAIYEQNNGTKRTMKYKLRSDHFRPPNKQEDTNTLQVLEAPYEHSCSATPGHSYEIFHSNSQYF